MVKLEQNKVWYRDMDVKKKVDSRCRVDVSSNKTLEPGCNMDQGCLEIPILNSDCFSPPKCE